MSVKIETAPTMSSSTADDRHKHAVMRVTMDLHCDLTGTGDPYVNNAEAARWLRWRLNEGWQEMRTSSLGALDGRVRDFARLTLDQWEREKAGTETR